VWGMKRKADPTDLRDEEWSVIAPVIPPAKAGGRPRSTAMREVLNALFSLLRRGGAWCVLPRSFPSGRRSTTTFGTSATRDSGSKSTRRYANESAARVGAGQHRRRPFVIRRRSRPRTGRESIAMREGRRLRAVSALCLSIRWE